MYNKSKYYYNTWFPLNVIRSAYQQFLSKANSNKLDTKPNILTIRNNGETWSYDSIEEFIAEYKPVDWCHLHHGTFQRFEISGSNGNRMEIGVRLDNRADIESVFQILEMNLDKSAIPVKSEPVRIFIGHGQNPMWKELKDHLHEKHGFEVNAYEIGERAGLSVKEVLQDMLTKNSIAFLVLTGEDVDNYGELHARENVIHELGLFQGYLGFTRAIALKEDGVKEFSNIFGISQIRFSKGNIKETFGEVLATIKREFASKSSDDN